MFSNIGVLGKAHKVWKDDVSLRPRMQFTWSCSILPHAFILTLPSSSPLVSITPSFTHTNKSLSHPLTLHEFISEPNPFSPYNTIFGFIPFFSFHSIILYFLSLNLFRIFFFLSLGSKIFGICSF